MRWQQGPPLHEGAPDWPSFPGQACPATISDGYAGCGEAAGDADLEPATWRPGPPAVRPWPESLAQGIWSPRGFVGDNRFILAGRFDWIHRLEPPCLPAFHAPATTTLWWPG